ncbi:MAG: response regulator [Sphingomonadaceae bacterium]
MSRNERRSVVLVVDDEAIILWGTASLLESIGYTVIRATSAMDALAALRDETVIDMLITDYQMPKMSGVELAVVARQLRPALPIVIATGDLTLNADACRSWITLPKPFTREELADAVARALSERQYDTSG